MASDDYLILRLDFLWLIPCFFCIAEWKGRDDGLVAHVFFKGSHNFALSVFAFAVEGWLFYSAVNAIIPQIILHLGFETDAFIIGLRGLAVSGSAAVVSGFVTYSSSFHILLRRGDTDPDSVFIRP